MMEISVILFVHQHHLLIHNKNTQFAFDKPWRQKKRSNQLAWIIDICYLLVLHMQDEVAIEGEGDSKINLFNKDNVPCLGSFHNTREYILLGCVFSCSAFSN